MSRELEIKKEIDLLQKELYSIKNEENRLYQEKERKNYEDKIKGRSFYDEKDTYISLYRPKNVDKNFVFHEYCTVPCTVFTLYIDTKGEETLFANEHKHHRLDHLTKEIDRDKAKELKTRILSMIDEKLDKFI